MTQMTTEIAISTPLKPLQEAPAAPQAASDDQLVAIWLHGRSTRTQRAYRSDAAPDPAPAGRWCASGPPGPSTHPRRASLSAVAPSGGGAGKPLPSVTLADL